MKTDQSQHGAKGKPRNGPFKDHFKIGTVSWIGRFKDGERIGLSDHANEHERMDYTSHA